MAQSTHRNFVRTHAKRNEQRRGLSYVELSVCNPSKTQPALSRLRSEGSKKLRLTLGAVLLSHYSRRIPKPPAFYISTFPLCETWRGLLFVCVLRCVRVAAAVVVVVAAAAHQPTEAAGSMDQVRFSSSSSPATTSSVVVVIIILLLIIIIITINMVYVQQHSFNRPLDEFVAPVHNRFSRELAKQLFGNENR